MGPGQKGGKPGQASKKTANREVRRIPTERRKPSAYRRKKERDYASQKRHRKLRG